MCVLSCRERERHIEEREMEVGKPIKTTTIEAEMSVGNQRRRRQI